MQLNLIPTGDHAAKDGHAPIIQFFVNVGVLADKQGKQQAAILFGMLFTLVIWVITLVNLMVAVVLYLLFLFHHIPSADGGLSGYCRRKINKSMEKIVKAKVDKALKKENALRARQEAWQATDAMKRQPTLPNLDASGEEKTSTLSRQTTQATLPEYTSRAGSTPSSAVASPSDLERQPTLPDLERRPTLPNLDSDDFRPAGPTRVDTNASYSSWASYGSNAPLMRSAGDIGYGPPGQIQSPGAQSSSRGYNSRTPTNRSYSGHSQATQRSHTPGLGSRPSVGHSGRSTPGSYQMEPVPRLYTDMSRSQTPVGPSPVESYGRRTPAEQNNPYFPPTSDYLGRTSSPSIPRSNTPGGSSTRSYTPGAPPSTRSITPAVPSYSRPYSPDEPPMPPLPTNASSASGRYQGYSARSQSSAQSPFTLHAPYRSFTQPNMSKAAPEPRGQRFDQSSPSIYSPQPGSGHSTPIQRPGTAPPTNRQTTPVADHVMEDIMNGY
jgi:Fungal potassium channel